MLDACNRCAADFYLSNYNLAGFQGPGLSLTPEMMAICLAANWTTANGLACDDKSVHSLNGLQHFNADVASCGYGCSGNPYDAYWAFSLTSWGDAHEVGDERPS